MALVHRVFAVGTATDRPDISVTGEVGSDRFNTKHPALTGLSTIEGILLGDGGSPRQSQGLLDDAIGRSPGRVPDWLSNRLAAQNPLTREEHP